MPELHLIHGEDDALVSQSVVELVRRLVGEEDRSLVVADITIDGDEVGIERLIGECQTPPFLTSKRVVVARDANKLDAAALAVLQGYLAEPLPTTDLVLVYVGRPPKRWTDAARNGHGHVVGTDVGASRKDRSSFVDDQIAASGLRFTPAAQSAVTDRLGEDLNRLAGLLDTLLAAFGPDMRLDVGDIEPFLGGAGGIPPWDLTDAIDRGDRAAALDALSRMTGAGGRHPLQVMAILHTHYLRLLRLDGSGAHDEVSAGAVLGVKGFAAKKALGRAKAMGPDAIHDAVQLLAGADLDLRGRRELPEDAVLEVLVARLCRLGAASRGGARPARR